MRSPGRKSCVCFIIRCPSKAALIRPFCVLGESGIQPQVKRERGMLPLLPEPMTKEEWKRELLTLPLEEAESRRAFWTLCEALQAMEDTHCSPAGLVSAILSASTGTALGRTGRALARTQASFARAPGPMAERAEASPSALRSVIYKQNKTVLISIHKPVKGAPSSLT